jgi:hypothetical protein
MTGNAATAASNAGADASKSTLVAGGEAGNRQPPVEHRFQPGRSGNPSGRNGANHVVNRAISQATEDGAKLVRFWVALACGELIDLRTGELIRLLTPKEQARFMTRAAEWLSDRLLGRTPLVIEATSTRFEELRITYQELIRDASLEDRLAAARLIAGLRAKQQAALQRRAIEAEVVEAMAENGGREPRAAKKVEIGDGIATAEPGKL